MSHPFDSFASPGLPGRLLFTPCPGTRDTTLDEALETLKAAGASGLITLMPMDELLQNGAGDIGQRCEAHGLRWFHLPVADEQSPAQDFDEAWLRDWPGIEEMLEQGAALAIHCKGGSGRTGLIAARILIARGMAADEASDAVQQLRPKAIRHPAHLAWIASVA